MNPFLLKDIVRQTLPLLQKNDPADSGKKSQKFQMDELSKKDLRNIKKHYKIKFKRYLPSRPKIQELDDYLQRLVDFFYETFECRLYLDQLALTNLDEYITIIWIFFPLPIQKFIYLKKGINIKQPEVFEKGYKRLLNQFLITSVGKLLFAEPFFICWQRFYEQSDIDQNMKVKYAEYLRTIGNVIGNQWRIENDQQLECQKQEEQNENISPMNELSISGEDGSSIDFYERCDENIHYEEERTQISSYGNNTFFTLSLAEPQASYGSI